MKGLETISQHTFCVCCDTVPLFPWIFMSHLVSIIYQQTNISNYRYMKEEKFFTNNCRRLQCSNRIHNII